MNLLFSWSTGKDSALALYDCLKSSSDQVKGLWTTVNGDREYISFHGVSKALLKKQAASIGLPLSITNLPDNCTNKQYEALIKDVYDSFIENKVEAIAFADLYLEDIRQYREKQLNASGLEGVFPLWRKSTSHTAERFISTGFKAVITTVDQTKIHPRWIGKEFDQEFLTNLPHDVDPCGENGEFHTFVFNGPIFHYQVDYVVKDKVEHGPYITALLTHI
ncbi:diphthine--ammonia ligase [Pseudalkalibacillus hwajinpoensis]|uniref:Diphthine--ammonia ligase n=1 Tax=Guptibacillus hwajinpoensis TaxID=208199 RepID=A0A4U1MLY5_9BACL|nr:diphthine--ammonia ligase [Pseudalkalibacillus hwajinpoensis]TKD71927.1 diphthine--ammonia ligase [Pseudalkalibacillus hwajinpoensis]